MKLAHINKSACWIQVTPACINQQIKNHTIVNGYEFHLFNNLILATHN